MLTSSVLMAFFLPCAGMAVLLIVYLFLVRCAVSTLPAIPISVKSVSSGGLSALELQQLGRVRGHDLPSPTECAVCLSEIEKDHSVRLIPPCNHAFHLECADPWLSSHRLCPLCRANLPPHHLFARNTTSS